MLRGAEVLGVGGFSDAVCSGLVQLSTAGFLQRCTHEHTLVCGCTPLLPLAAAPSDVPLVCCLPVCAREALQVIVMSCPGMAGSSSPLHGPVPPGRRVLGLPSASCSATLPTWGFLEPHGLHVCCSPPKACSQAQFDPHTSARVWLDGRKKSSLSHTRGEAAVPCCTHSCGLSGARLGSFVFREMSVQVDS